MSRSVATPFILAAVLSVGCAIEEIKDVQFVVPDDFHGRFVIVENPTGPKALVVHGRIQIDVPDSGIVELANPEVLLGTTRRTARFASGKALPYEYDVSDETVAVRSLGQIGRLGQPDRSEFFVGTEVEAYAASVDTWPVEH